MLDCKLAPRTKYLNMSDAVKKFAFLILFQAFLCAHTCDYVFVDKEKSAIRIEWVDAKALSQEEEVFQRSFWQSFASIKDEELKIVDKAKHIKDAFVSLQSQLTHGEVYAARALDDKRCIGFVAFTPTKQSGQLYIAKLVVDPDYWGRNIGKELAFSALKRLPSTKSIIINYRKSNYSTDLFFRKIGFKPSNYLRASYNPDLYIGAQWDSP